MSEVAEIPVTTEEIEQYPGEELAPDVPADARPATIEELGSSIARINFQRRVQAAISIPRPRKLKLRCAVCPARNKFVEEYETKAGKILLCVKCADVMRQLALKEAAEIEAKAKETMFQGAHSRLTYDRSKGGYAQLFFEVPGQAKAAER
jgi:hypothetical protein